MQDLEHPIHPLLRRAIRRWRVGNPISLSLAARLMGLGYDVNELERRYVP